jgi:hypothetical protein
LLKLVERLVVIVAEVEVASAIWTGCDTIAAADADGVIDDNDSIFFPLPGGAYRAHRHTGWILAVVAEDRQEAAANMGIFAHFFLDYFGVGNARRRVVFLFAGDGTGLATHASLQIYHHHPVALICRLIKGSLHIIPYCG